MTTLKLFSILMMVVMILGACAPAATPNPPQGAATKAPSDTAQTAPEAQKSHSDTLIVGVPHVPTNVNPAFSESSVWSFTNINLYERLWTWRYPDTPNASGIRRAMSDQGDAGIDGELCEAFTRISPTEVECKLREGVKSNYGNELTVDDVLWSIERVFGLKAPGTFIWTSSGITDMSHVKKIDKYTLRFVTDTPNPLLPRHVMTNQGVIIDSVEAKKHATAEDPWAQDFLAKNTPTYGAYAVKEIMPGQSMTLVYNENYHGDAPYFKTVILREIPEAANRYAMLATGDIDVVDKYLTYDQLNLINGGAAPNVKLVYDPEALNMFNRFTFNTTKPPFDQEKARQAVGYAIPYDAIDKVVFKGLGKISQGHVAPAYEHAVEDCWPYKHDLEMAKKLWDESGAPREFTVLWTNETGYAYDIGVLLQTEMAKIDVNVTLNPLPAAAFQQKRKEKDFQMFFSGGASMTAADAGNSLQDMVGESPFNYSGFMDEESLELMGKYMSVTSDDPSREGLLRQGQCRLIEKMPALIVYWNSEIIAAQKGLEGFVWNTDTNMRLRFLHWNE